MLAAALALGAAAPSLAESWTPIGQNPAGDKFELDQDSLKMRDGAVDARVRVKLHAPSKDNLGGRFYVTGVTERLENCSQALSATIAYVYYDDSGAVTSSYSVALPAWQFITVAPGTLGEQFQTRICEAARSHGLLGHAPSPPPSGGAPGRLVASLKIGPSVKEGWTLAATDKTDNSQVFVLEGSVFKGSGASGNEVVFFQKMVRPRLTQFGDGTPYLTAYSVAMIDCTNGDYGVGATDFYGEGDKLVSTVPEKIKDMVLYPSKPDTLQAMVREAVCKPGVAKSSPPPSKDNGGAGGDDEDDGAFYTGTGWMGPKGYLITANHVTEGMDHLVLYQGGHVVGTAQVVLADPANDVAVLKPKFRDGAHPSIAFSVQPAVLGERVFTLGYPAPDVLGVSLKMTSGEVSALDGLDAQSHRIDDARLMQISVPVQSGNSGGPVMADDGRAVGIVISRMERTGEDETAQNINYALKISYVRALLAELPDIGGYRPARLEPTRAAAVADLQGGVFMIVGTKDKAPAK
ncbi:MAG TPA: serine protease [Caulobacteraceae bacterium]